MNINDDTIISIIMAATWIIPLLFSIIPHEVAHGYVAYRLGDPTAKEAGRLSLNPIKHIDLYGTIIIPIFLMASNTGFVFGYAKPVPVNFSRLKDPRRGMILVAASGPCTNFILAGLFTVFLYLLQSFSSLENIIPVFFYTSFMNTILLNLVLGIFNLLPLPPLDGGKIVMGLLPPSLGSRYAKLDGRLGFIILIILIFMPRILGEQFNVIGKFIDFFINAILSLPFL
ncbi:MAG: site-2 protease family protein [Spirochaetes bacterium]|jgi:Zn-dependent protease|nr:site-2 protease family protein [Spirochaetota bacterium]